MHVDHPAHSNVELLKVLDRDRVGRFIHRLSLSIYQSINVLAA